MALLPTNQRDQLMVFGCVLAIIGAGAYWNYLYSPKSEELEAKRTRVEKLVQLNQTAEREVAKGNAQKVQAEADEYARILTVMRQLVPSGNEVPALIDQISTAARQSGLEIGELTPLGVIQGDVFDTYRYRMGVVGSYHRIGELLTSVGSLTRIMAPMNLSLGLSTRAPQNQPRRPGESLLNASFEVQTYVAKPTATGAARAGAP